MFSDKSFIVKLHITEYFPKSESNPHEAGKEGKTKDDILLVAEDDSFCTLKRKVRECVHQQFRLRGRNVNASEWPYADRTSRTGYGSIKMAWENLWLRVGLHNFDTVKEVVSRKQNLELYAWFQVVSAPTAKGSDTPPANDTFTDASKERPPPYTEVVSEDVSSELGLPALRRQLDLFRLQHRRHGLDLRYD